MATTAFRAAADSYRRIRAAQIRSDDRFLQEKKSGGVLRKNPGTMSDEINITTDGTFKATLPTGGTIVNTLNKMRLYGYNYGNGTYDVDGTNGGTFCSWV